MKHTFSDDNLDLNTVSISGEVDLLLYCLLLQCRGCPMSNVDAMAACRMSTQWLH